MSEDAAKPLWSLDVPTLEHSIATDLAAAGPVSLLFAGIAAGCAPAAFRLQHNGGAREGC